MSIYGYNYNSFNNDIKVINQSGYEYIHDLKKATQTDELFNKTSCNFKKANKLKLKKKKM